MTNNNPRNEMTRNEIAKRVEEYLVNHAGIIREEINGGCALFGAMTSERAKYWIRETERAAQELNNL